MTGAQTGEVLAVDPSLPTVQAALARAAKACGPIGKDDMNAQQGFKYRGIERILHQAGPALTAAGVVVLPRVVGVEREAMERGANHTVWRLVTLTVQYDFVGPAGDTLTAVVLGEGLDNGDKAVSKALTMAFKAVLLQVLKVGDGASDPDADSPPEQQASSQPPSLIPGAYVARLQLHADGKGLTPDEVAEAVDTATGRRTDQLTFVRETEVQALRDALAHIVARKEAPAGDDLGRPFEEADAS